MKKILEIACFNYESAIIAANSGADRIEFCSDFKSGGLTPDLKETEKLIREIKIPVFVMIRNKPDFLIEKDEMKNIKLQMSNFESVGVSGFVFGFLSPVPRLSSLAPYKIINQQLVKSTSLPCTLHRAFDRTENLFQTLEEAIEIGFKRILCSGGKGNAVDNIETLKLLNEKSKGRITIMPGGGVRSSNIEKLLETGCEEFHSSGIVEGQMADEREIKKIKTRIII